MDPPDRLPPVAPPIQCDLLNSFSHRTLEIPLGSPTRRRSHTAGERSIPVTARGGDDQLHLRVRPFHISPDARETSDHVAAESTLPLAEHPSRLISSRRSSKKEKRHVPVVTRSGRVAGSRSKRRNFARPEQAQLLRVSFPPSIAHGLTVASGHIVNIGIRRLGPPHRP